ncbi:MAG: branched-chain amino acid ABC transporter permease [Geminicoccaceae bacterium]|nr:branched-chain amino acid ABC transporter permease [Geminicoccaceae bacterium]
MQGYLLYALSLLSLGGIYAILALGLNLQWGMAGLFNAGIAGFFASGAYTAAILGTPPVAGRLGGFDLPMPVTVAAAALFSAAIGWAVGRLCIRLRTDYLAIATIGIAEILRLIVRNEGWLTGGSLGISGIVRPFDGLGPPRADIGYLAVVLGCLVLVYIFVERAGRSPWGRTMRAIRDDERAAAALGKDVDAFRLQAFALGSGIMGGAGALTAYYFRFLSPDATEPLLTTFLVWVMLIAGGSGNNRGAILGAFLVWTLWSSTELVTGRLPADWAANLAYLRVLLIGLLLQVVLQRFAGGILPERARR